MKEWLSSGWSGGEDAEDIRYQYDYKHQLKRVIKVDGATQEITEYSYNPKGIRVGKHNWTEIDGTPQGDDVYTDYLIDAYNHTGYAQTIEEKTGSTRTTYTIGDDVITQFKTGGQAQHLLYDGHGSTRQLASAAGSITESYSYDGYGVMLGGNPARGSTPETSLLYAGEHFDTDAQQYYLRARWYDSLNGRFSQLDPYAGNNYDPQSLHKYLYCHANPVNAIDPSGKFSIATVVIGVVIGAILVGITAHYYTKSVITALPRPVQIRISINPSGKPDTWDTSEIELRLKQLLAPAWATLRAGQSVHVELVEEPQPSEKLGWTEQGGLKMRYYGRVKFQKPVIPVLLATAYAYTPEYTTTISTEGTTNYLVAWGFEASVIWPVMWTNFVAHEQFYLAVGGNWDNVFGPPFTLSSKDQSINTPSVLTPPSIKAMIKGMGLSQR